jgi:hypothetical protein
MAIEKPLLTPNQVAVLSDQLAKLHQAMADADRIERCGFECGDIRATIAALSVTIKNMLAIMGNVPPGAINAIGAPPTGQMANQLVNHATGQS